MLTQDMPAIIKKNIKLHKCLLCFVGRSPSESG